LIDEIFKGTNNRERLIGSRSYIQNLVGQNGSGLIATHDLELIKLADQFPNITNCHFREEVADGKMVFDYKLRPGPCPTTNALKIPSVSEVRRLIPKNRNKKGYFHTILRFNYGIYCNPDLYASGALSH
jgi:DNA mismatch repair ATPase MutS